MTRSMVYVAACALLILVAQNADAHSRKDLKRITLQSETLVADQVAFYLEPYVNNQADEDGVRNRFAIWEFQDIVHEGDLAMVHVLVYDQKSSQKTPEVLYLQRNPDQTWNHVTKAGEVIEARIYTYVNPDNSISSGGHGPSQAKDPLTTYAMGGGVLVLGGVLLVMMRRRSKHKAAQKDAGVSRQ
ncbi:MAG: hypothetical protein LDL27_13005 [Desulfovibrio sp.]|nr:hypothetical protein [Desulfovibrio sp.]